MRPFKYIVQVLVIAITLCIALPAFAESAPVYDVDSLPQQMDEEGEDQQQDVPPPPPGQEGAYVPSQTTSPSSANLSPRVAGTENMSMEQRVKRMEQQVKNMQNNDAAARMDELQNQVQALRGQVEQLTHQLEQMQSQQKSLYSDLDKRLAQQKNPPKASASVSDSGFGEDASVINPKSSKIIRKTNKIANKTPDTEKKSLENQPNVAEEQQIYQTAYSLIKTKKYNDAVNALQNMLQKYPSGQFASNAHYWLGELYGLMGKNDQALAEFNLVVKSYTSSPRISDAQLKVGLILAAQSKWPEAKTALKKVINRYPGTAPARLASEQLKQIKEAGH